MKTGHFDIFTSDFYISDRVPVSPQCYGFMYRNLGDTFCKVNDVLLKPFPPGFPFLDGGFFGFVDEQGRLLNIKWFTISFLAPIGVAPHIQISQSLLFC